MQRPEEAARLLTQTQRWRSQGLVARELSLYRLVLEVLTHFAKEGTTTEVRFGATLASMLLTESRREFPRLTNGFSAIDAMKALAGGEAIPAWQNSPFTLPKADSTRKRRHHYVWQFYLKGWADKNGTIWCRRRGGSPFRTGTTAVGLRTDFYRLRELNADDIQLVTSIIDKADSRHLRELNQGWLTAFNILFELRREYEAMGMPNKTLEDEIDVQISNLEENLHASIEGTSVPYLEALRNADLEFLCEEQGLIHFCRFLAVQSLRGPGLEHRVMRGWGNIRTVGVLRHVLGTTVGWSLYAGRAALRMSLFEAPPSTEFITGDESVINIRAIPGKEPESLELYYPVSPRLAFLVAADHPAPGIYQSQLDSRTVMAFNRLIAERAHEQIYAADSSVLTEYWG